MRNQRNKTAIVLVLAVMGFSLASFVFTARVCSEKIGQRFPGYLSFENGLVGPYYVPGWSGPREGIRYHDVREEMGESTETFSQVDYLLVVLLPAVSGLLFALAGGLICLFLPVGLGRVPLLLFHFLVGNYLILSPEFHLSYQLSYLYLIFFAFIPAAMIHFALSFPQGQSRRRSLLILPYLLSALLAAPYLFLFKSDPGWWVGMEYVMVVYVVATYLFWLVRLGRGRRRPQHEFERILARYLLRGQVIAFVVPLLATLAIFVGRFHVPLNLITPLTLLFPLSLFIGLILGQLRQSQLRLVMSEKQAALGVLGAGIAHELKNPINFIYANLDPLADHLKYLKASLADRSDPELNKSLATLEEISSEFEEGATRAKEILEGFGSLSALGDQQKRKVDLHALLENSLKLLAPKWRERIEIRRRYGDIPELLGQAQELSQVFVNLISNACDAIRDQGTIEISTERSGGAIIVRIRDTGEGIARADVARIFDPFFTTKEVGRGVGLGLALCLDIVKNHGGDIDLKSEEKKGTEFIVTLPLS